MSTPEVPDPPSGFDPELEELPRTTRGFLLSAALVSRFRPERLTALDANTFDPIDPSEAERNAALSFVIDNSSPSGFEDPAQFGWTLNEDLRARIFKAIGSLDRLRRAVQRAGLGIGDAEPLKLYFEQPKQGADTTFSELSARRQALVWLQPFLASSDELRSLDRNVLREGLLAPLKQLAGDAFVGRTSELEFLRRFVGVLPAESKKPTTLLEEFGSIGSAIGELGSDFSDWASSLLRDDDVVLVTAPGGMGKSALLARLILWHHEAEPQRRVPFAFLDFDRPSLLSGEPWLPLEEIARQLSIQLDTNIVAPWRDHVSERQHTPGDIGALTSDVAIGASYADRAYVRRQDARTLARRIAQQLSQSSMSGKPLLLVMDTLERVFHRGRHWISAIEEMIDLLRSETRRKKTELRVIAGGRAFLSDARKSQTLSTGVVRWQERKLHELASDAAQALLVRLDVPKDVVDEIVESVGGVPLTLRLAANFIKRHSGDVKALTETTRSWLFRRRLEDQIVQGNLYQRILSRIEDPEVAALACPGLVLREVTPALIRDVLAEPCGLGEVDEEKAQVLFDKLAEEFTLVESSGPGRLKHRSDVRQLMLKQILAADPERSRRISERAALQYFAQQSDLKSRAEELYHLLLLGRDREEIDARWMEGVEDFLGEDIINDISSIALRVYAAARLNVTVLDEEWLREADQETWERKVEHDFEALVKLDKVDEALSLIKGRSNFTPGSRLYPLVAQAYANQRDYKAAERWIDTGLQHVERVADSVRRRTLVDLFVVRARNYEYVAAKDLASSEAARKELEQLDALWREYPGDSQVILVGLLEYEALDRMGFSKGTKLDAWLLDKMREMRARGDSVDPNIASRMLAIVGKDPARLAVSRWLIDIAGVRESLLRVLSESGPLANLGDDPRVLTLINKLRRRPEADAQSGASPRVASAAAEFNEDEIAQLAWNVATAAEQTRLAREEHAEGRRLVRSTQISQRLGLALSGGGFRASFYHIGVLARMAELGMLRHVESISTVSGGSIVGAAYYLLLKGLLEAKADQEICDEDYVRVIERLESHFLQAVQENLRMRTFVNPLSNLRMVLPRYSRSDAIGAVYEKHIYRPLLDVGDRRIRMSDLLIVPMGSGGVFHPWDPNAGNAVRAHKVPVLILNATNLNSGHNWTFTATSMGEVPPRNLNFRDIDKKDRYRRVRYDQIVTRAPYFLLGNAVAASAGVPGLLPPMAVSNMYKDKRVQLVDGGVFDNQGIAGLLDPDNLCTDFVVSDASGQSDATNRPKTDALAVLVANSGILGDRVREEMVNSLELTRAGHTAYFHLTRGLFAKDIEVNKQGTSALPGAKMSAGIVASEEEFGVAQEAQRFLAHIRTDLDSFTDVEAGCLQADGYQMSEPRLLRLSAFLAKERTPGRWQFDRYREVLRTPGRQARVQLDIGRNRFFKPFLYAVRGASGPAKSLGLLLVSLPFLASVILILLLIDWALKTYVGLDVWKIVADQDAFRNFMWKAAPGIYGVLIAFVLSKVAETVIRGSGPWASWIQTILKGPMSLISALVVRIVLPPIFAVPVLLYLLVDRYFIRVMGRLD